MDRAEFQTLLDTLELDPEQRPRETIRGATTTPTVAYGGLPSVQLGTTTDPEFELGDTIGEGGMGVVRTARQLALHRDVAVKTLRDDRKTATAREGLLHEALVTGGLEHPNVVPVYTLGQTADGAPVIVMKRIEGVPWSECIDDPSRAGTLVDADPLGWHLEIFAQLCRAVHFAHSRGIVHRDIKPENVMIGAYGEVYLVDWGVAVTTDRDKDYLLHVDDTEGICGTPAYMAPEMTTGRAGEIGVHTDVYLLGATLLHVTTGEVPHDGDSLFQIMHHAYESRPPEPQLPAELVAILQKAMAREASERFESADALRRAVSDFDHHRQSIALIDEVADRLDELRALVDAADAGDDAVIRGLVGECRFGAEQALKMWPQNAVARRLADDATRELIRWELSRENLSAAESALNRLHRDEPELRERVNALRASLAEREADVADLRRMRSDLDLSAAAGTRTLVAVVLVVFWTVIPLGAGFFVRRGWSAVTHNAFFNHGLVVAALLTGTILLLRQALLQNQANRRIIRLAIAFAAWLPCFRFAVWQLEVPVVDALTMELMSYGLVVGGIALMSDRWATFPVAVYLAAGLGSAFMPAHIYEWIAVANLFAVGWLAVIWARQRSRGDIGDAEPPEA